MLGKKIIFLVSDKIRFLFFIICMTTVLTLILCSLVFFSQSSHNSLKGISIIIDPGHGGIDKGVNDNLSFFEKDINLQIAKKLQVVLKSNHVNEELTKDSDTHPYNMDVSSPGGFEKDLASRESILNSGRYDIFICLHVNCSANSNTSGPLVLYSPAYPSNEILAGFVQNSLNECLIDSKYIKTGHKPVKSDYSLLKNSDIPGILIETGFISNKTEKELLQSSSYQSKLANAIYKGIEDYYSFLKESNN